MSLRNFSQILRIVSEYVDVDTTDLQVNHDIIYLPLFYGEVALSVADEATLEALGAHKDTEYRCWAYFCN